MASKRRKEYLPIANPLYEIYHSSFDRFRVQSQVLNSHQNVSLNTVLWDKTNIQAYLRELAGDKDGKYLYKDGDFRWSSISEAKMKEQQILKKFERFKKDRQNQGFPDPVMPVELLEEILKCHARQDVLEEERESLEEKLDNYVEEVEKEDESHLLEFGLHGSGKLTGGILSELDGMKIVQLKDKENEGLLVIANGPYKGLSVLDYRKLQKEYFEQMRKARDVRLKRLRIEARENGTDLPTDIPVFSGKRVSLSSLPAFPKWAEQYNLKTELPQFEESTKSKSKPKK
jgi:hypothetical protein